ncbi:hypothetical protein [Vibrio mediterranei]|uniref:hypothetical protein n=1 Tax=Vibrio mediterranei TaxID=689 RepID=UPI00148CF2CF|nr:hypothetical protein [Vibrio mediterranei]NOI26810.1 hypothetical protein [Vibrio mediterranei]
MVDKYVVRTKNGVVFININNRKLTSFIYPPESPDKKISFQVEIESQDSRLTSLHIIDLSGNGDDSSFCSQGFGSELVLTSFSVLNTYLQEKHSCFEPSLIEVTGTLCPSGEDGPNAHKRRRHFWSKFFRVKDVKRSYAKIESSLQSVLNKTSNCNVFSGDNLPSRPTAFDVVSQLCWTSEDDLAIEAIIHEIEDYHRLIDQIYCQPQQNKMETFISLSEQHFRCLFVITFWARRYMLKKKKQEQYRVEQERKIAIAKLDSANFGVVYRYLSSHHIDLFFSVGSGLYSGGFMLNPYVTVEQLSEILRKARIDKQNTATAKSII